jgi:hypothetical protein
MSNILALPLRNLESASSQTKNVPHHFPRSIANQGADAIDLSLPESLKIVSLNELKSNLVSGQLQRNRFSSTINRGKRY